MRIAIATSEYHRRGGFPRHAADLAVGLHRLGHSVVVYAQEAMIEPGPMDAGIEFRTYPWIRRPLLAHMATHPWIVGRLARSIAPTFDAVISVGIPCSAPVTLVGPGTHRAWFLKSRRMLPWWSPRRLVEGLRPFHRIVLFWERRMLRGRHPRVVLVPSERRAAEYRDLYGYPPERIALVPNPIVTEEFSFDPAERARIRAELGIPEGVPVLLNIAGRGRQKGIDVLVSALERLPTSLDYRAVLAGKASEHLSVWAATGKLRRAGVLRLLGRVPDVRPLYCAADLLVFPSRYDGWGLPVSEALACGLPVVCGADLGAAICVREGENGFVVSDPDDHDALRDRIELALDRLGSWSRAAVAATVAPFERDHVAAALVTAVSQARGQVS